MKRSSFILLLSLPLLIAACNKKLDLEPENTLVDRDVFRTESGTEQALAEAYFNLLKAVTSNIAYVFGDFTTPTLLHGTYYNIYYNGEATPSDEAVTAVWTAYYKAINTANNVATNIPLYATYSENTKNQFIAESKFIRAYAYLDLLKMFGEGALTGNMDGLGLPLQLTPFEGYNTGDVIPRSSNGEVYSHIVQDLKDILPLLPDNHNTDVKTRARATKGSVNALLARCYLYMHKYAEAGETAKAVLNKQPDIYAITTDLRKLFPENTGTSQVLTPEYVFAFPVSQMVSFSTYTNNNIGNSYYFKNSFWINPAFISEFETGDLRVSQLMFKGDQIYNVNRLNDFTTFKFNNSNGRDNVPLIRLPEMMLTRAEALARTTGVTTEAVSLLNEVRTRSLPSATPFTVNDFTDPAALVEKILLQRKFELAFEGFHRYDLIRTGKPLRVPDLSDKKKVLPIPQLEIDISNGVIKQNSGYVL